MKKFLQHLGRINSKTFAVVFLLLSIVAFVTPKGSRKSCEQMLTHDPNGQNAKIAGAPGDANAGFTPATCASCHANSQNGGASATNDNQDAGSISMTFPGALTPGTAQTGTITLRVPSSSSLVGGFQLLATNGNLSNNTVYGTLANIAGQGTKIFTSAATGRMTQSSAKTMTGSGGFVQCTWNFNYTAPVGATSVRFYYTGHAGTFAFGQQDGLTYVNSLLISGVVPVKISQFSATEQRNDIRLNWAAENESSINHYEVEVSTDGSNFTKLGTVYPYSSSDATKDYSYSDNTNYINTKTVFYRIKSVDNGNTRYAYTNIASVNLASRNKNVLSVTPSVTNGPIAMQFLETATSKILLTVIDESGKTVLSKSFTVTTGVNRIEADLSKNAPGIYFVKLSRGAETYVQTIMKN